MEMPRPSLTLKITAEFGLEGTFKGLSSPDDTENPGRTGWHSQLPHGRVGTRWHAFSGRIAGSSWELGWVWAVSSASVTPGEPAALGDTEMGAAGRAQRGWAGKALSVISTGGKVRVARVGKASTRPRGAITGGFVAGFCKGNDHRSTE